MYTYKDSKKMMIRMIHSSLPTCEKINRLVEKERNNNYSNDFYSQRYESYTNDGYCPCCNQDIETIEHLFAHCQNEDIVDIRQGIHHNIYEVMKKRFGPGTPSPKTFFYDKRNQETQPDDHWDLYLGTLGIIPKTVEKYIDDMLEDEDKDKLKYIICDISEAIMKQNIEIWKQRCKLLYGSRNNNYNPP